MTVKGFGEIPAVTIDEHEHSKTPASMVKVENLPTTEEKTPLEGAPVEEMVKVENLHPTDIQQKIVSGIPLTTEEKLLVFAEEHQKFIEELEGFSSAKTFLGRCASAWENRLFKLIPDVRELV